MQYISEMKTRIPHFNDIYSNLISMIFIPSLFLKDKSNNPTNRQCNNSKCHSASHLIEGLSARHSVSNVMPVFPFVVVLIGILITEIPCNPFLSP